MVVLLSTMNIIDVWQVGFILANLVMVVVVATVDSVVVLVFLEG